jgi:hypothetical protein
MIITIASSDKLTLAMFSDFFKSLYSSDVKIVDLNCLYSGDILAAKLKELTTIDSSGRDVLIKFKLKTQTKEISPILIDNSHVVVKFDIFSTEPEVIKEGGADTHPMLDRWKMNIEKLNKQKI